MEVGRAGGPLPFVPRSGRAITGWTTALLVAGVLPQYLLIALVVEMQNEFAVTDAQLGIAIAGAFGISSVVSPLAGRALHRVGIRTGVTASAAIVITGCTWFAVAVDSAAAVIFGMALIGLGGGIGSPSFSALLAAKVGSERHGSAFGWLTSAPQIAAFVSGLALPAVAEPLGWRVPYAIAAGLSLTALSVLVASGLPRTPVGDEDGEGNGERPRPHASVWTLAVATAFASAAGLGMRAFLVVFAAAVGFSDAGAGFLLSAAGLVALFSRVGLGILGDRRPGDSLIRTAWLMALCAVGFVLMAVDGMVAVAAGAIIAGGLGWGWNAPMSLAVVSQNRGAVGPAIGIQMSGFFLGAMIGPLLVGLFAEHASFETAWIVCGALAAAGAAVCMLARRQGPAGAALGGPGEEFPRP